jgi:YVTN family beta-propeller protein
MRARSLFVSTCLVLAPAAAPAQPYAYVSGAGADSIGVVDLATLAVVGSFPVTGVPSGSALIPGGALFVSRTRLDSVARIDTVSGAVTSIPVGAGPAGVALGIAPDPAPPTGRKRVRVFVANGGSDSVSVIDADTAAVVATIPVGDAPLDVVASGTRAYVGNWGDGTVSVIDATTNTVVGSVTVGTFPAGLALHPQAGRLYVANFFDDTVSVIDTASLSVVATVPVVRRPRGVTVDPVANRLYVAGFEDALIDVIDTATNAVVLQAPSGGANPLDLLVDPDGQRLYVAHLEAGPNVRVLQAATLAPLAAVATPDGAVSLAGFGQQAPTLEDAPGRIARAIDDLRSLRPFRTTAARPDVARAAASPTEVTILDGTFAIGDWEVIAATGPHVTTQEALGGNPGFWRRSTHQSGPTETETFHRLVRPDARYDPAAQGEIATLDVSWDRQNVTPGFCFERVVLVQDGTIYRTGAQGFTVSTWQAASRTGLMAPDFSSASGANPDFGPSGGVITFGYARRTSPSDVGFVHGIDNFRVTVHQTGGGPAGSIRFRSTTSAVASGEFVGIELERVGGTDGPVTATVLVTPAFGSPFSFTLGWVHGDGAPKVHLHLALFSGSTAATDRLQITSVTGAASIGNRDAMAVLIYPPEWELEPLLLNLLLVLAGLSPGFLALLAGPALLLRARRGWTGTRRAALRIRQRWFR